MATDSDDHVHTGKQRRASHDQVETFEAEGQNVSSPGPTDFAVDWDTGLSSLRHVCKQLDVGHHGYLTLTELGQVCHYIGMERMNDEELKDLFHKLDVDRDGYISFDEFVNGMSSHTSTITITPRGFENPPLRPHSGRKVRSLVPPALKEKMSPSIYTSVGTVGLFSSLPSADLGFATGEEIADYWEKLNVPNGVDLLTRLGFDPGSKIVLKELSLALSTDWCGSTADSSPLGQAITATYHQELSFLRSGLDQTTEERNKLRSDLADALSRNALMAAEVDERHAQLEKSFNARLQKLEQEYREQIRHSQAELDKEHEGQHSQEALLKQSAEHIQQLKQRVTSLTDQLTGAEREASSAHREASQSREKQSDLENRCQRLQKEIEQMQQGQPDSPSSGSWEIEKQTLMARIQRYSAENKELKDRNDELVVQLDELQHRSSSSRRGSLGSQGRSASTSRIPVRARASSFSSDTSEWDDEDSSAETFYHGQRRQPPKEREKDRTPSLSAELKQHQRQSRADHRGHEQDSSEGERTPTETKNRRDLERPRSGHSLDKEKRQMWEQFQREVSQKLAEQRRELQEAFLREKGELLQQFESRQSLRLIEHREQIEALEDRLKQAEKQQKEARQDTAENLYTKSRVQELEKAKAESEKELQHWKQHYEIELQNLRTKYNDDLARLKASRDQRVRVAVQKLFEQGAGGLRGKLKEDFDRLVQKHRHEDKTSSSDPPGMEKEDLHASFEREKLTLIQHYESQIVELQQEVSALQQHFEAERTAFQQLQSGELAQSIRQELQVARRLRAQRIRAQLFPMESIKEQEEAGGQGGQLRHSWEEERRELMVQNQLLEEELTDLKGALVQERQRAAEAHSLRETIRCLRTENKEVQSMAESLKEKMSRIHQQQDRERANFERRIDLMEKDKEKALRVQALQLAGSMPHEGGRVEAQKEILQEVLQQVEAMRAHSPQDHPAEQSSLDELQGQITQLHHQLQEAKTAQLEFQQLKEESELLKQSNCHLEEMVRVLRQRSDKELLEREREDQDQLHDLWVEKKKLQNMLQRTTDKLLKTSAEMAAGQMQLVREVEQLKQKSASMVELETFTGLQVSLLETQRHAISLQEALTQRTQLADRIMAETEKERRQEREWWEDQKRETQTQLEASTEMYRHLALQHKALRQSSTRLAHQMKELYVENADLMTVLQQSEAKQNTAQRHTSRLEQQCQTWHSAVQRLLHQSQDELVS